MSPYSPDAQLAHHPAPVLLEVPSSVGTRKVSEVLESAHARIGKPDGRVLILHLYPMVILRTTNIQLRRCQLPLGGFHLLDLLSASRNLVAMVILTMVATLSLPSKKVCPRAVSQQVLSKTIPQGMHEESDGKGSHSLLL